MQNSDDDSHYPFAVAATSVDPSRLHLNREPFPIACRPIISTINVTQVGDIQYITSIQADYQSACVPNKPSLNTNSRFVRISSLPRMGILSSLVVTGTPLAWLATYQDPFHDFC